ncbi:MAG: DMT family transporter [Symploca sp. SIO2E6]|nr:DMT family transporter [Symploca sp. SIO2E6]
MIELELPGQKIAKSNLSAILTLCTALLAVSFAPIFIRLSETELGANATVFNRMFIFAVFFGIGGAIRSKIYAPQEVKEQEPITTQQWMLLVAVGITSMTTLILWAISLQYTSVAKSMLLNNLTPVFTCLGGWLFLNKRFDKRFIVGMVIALSGAIALGLEDLHSAEGHLIGDVYALLSAVFLGSYFLVVERLRDRFCATTILLCRCAIGSALLIPIVLLTEGQLFPTTWVAWLAVIGLGIISEGIGQRLLADCMDQLSSSFISLFLLLEPIVSAILAWMIFAESISTTTGLGFVVVLTGIYLAQSSKSATKEYTV